MKKNWYRRLLLNPGTTQAFTCRHWEKSWKSQWRQSVIRLGYEAVISRVDFWCGATWSVRSERLLYNTLEGPFSSVFLVITQRSLVKHGRFGRTYCSHLERSSLKMGLVGCPETSVLNHTSLRNNPEDGIIQANPSGGLRSRLETPLFDKVKQHFFYCHLAPRLKKE